MPRASVRVRGHLRQQRPVRPHYRMAFLKGEADANLLGHRTASQEIVLMSPAEFIRLAGGLPYDEAHTLPWRNRSDYDALRTRMAHGLPIDALFLDVDADTGQVESHEGRHRAMIAQELGIKEVPVILYHRAKGSYANIRPDPYHRYDTVHGKHYSQLIPRPKRFV